MPQNQNDMMFCEICKMNCYPVRPKFNILIFGIFAITILIILIIITTISFSFFTDLLLFIYFMWGFMALNPYLIYYALKKRDYCPSCYQKVVEKNLEYQPFGEKKPEKYKSLIPVRKAPLKLFCPFCGNSLTEGVKFCKSCGKKFEIQRSW
ncbi:MAG: hypothetical protein ACFFB0_15495 [Promethearchaeota archaeon]